MIKNFKIFENKLQDDILDKMLDKGVKFNSLDKYDQYTLRHGKEHPEKLEQDERDERTYIGIRDVLEFVYDKHENIGGQVLDDDSPPKPSAFRVSGTILYKTDEYEGYLELGQDYMKVEFKNQKNEEFDPRHDENHIKAMNFMFNNVIKDKLIPGREH